MILFRDHFKATEYTIWAHRDLYLAPKTLKYPDGTLNGTPFKGTFWGTWTTRTAWTLMSSIWLLLFVLFTASAT